jgi:hypothetical protein
MTRVFGRIIMTVVSIILIAAAAEARSYKAVYLKDGGIIECRKVWQDGGMINVLVNRDTFIALPRGEVNVMKTFPKRPAKAAKKKPAPVPPVTPDATSKPQSPPTKAAKQATPSTPPVAGKTIQPPARP